MKDDGLGRGGLRSAPAAVVPLYVHPAVDPLPWRRLADRADVVRAVVINVADGPGELHDPLYQQQVARLQAAGVQVWGYVDTGYGAVPAEAVIRHAGRWREAYGVDGVFLDQVASGAELLPHYRELVAGLRPLVVALNPGVHPDRGYADVADVLVTFEGPWPAYRRLIVDDWWAARTDRCCHLVHALPRSAARAAARRFAGVGHAFASHGRGANPWQQADDDVLLALAAVQSSQEAGALPARIES